MANINQIKQYLTQLIRDKNREIEEKIDNDKKIKEWYQKEDEIRKKIGKRKDALKEKHGYKGWQQETKIITQFEMDYIKQNITKDKKEGMKKLIEKYERMI